jgi:uncharacterized protein (TIGR02594 family)
MKPLWLEIAEKEIGIKEVKGSENPRIIEYHSTCTLQAKEDEVPWCSAFVNFSVTCAGIEGTNNALAKSWCGWGREIKTPELGCITVIKKKVSGEDKSTGSSTGHHVGFFISLENNLLKLLGGNQGDMVKESTFNLASYAIICHRIPKEEV